MGGRLGCRLRVRSGLQGRLSCPQHQQPQPLLCLSGTTIRSMSVTRCRRRVPRRVQRHHPGQLHHRSTPVRWLLHRRQHTAPGGLKLDEWVDQQTEWRHVFDRRGPASTLPTPPRPAERQCSPTASPRRRELVCECIEPISLHPVPDWVQRGVIREVAHQPLDRQQPGWQRKPEKLRPVNGAVKCGHRPNQVATLGFVASKSGQPSAVQRRLR